MESTQE
jgi:hypothetical protein